MKIIQVDRPIDPIVLRYRYETDQYFDIAVTTDQAAGWSMQLTIKDLPGRTTKQFESQLFEPYIENPIVYKCVIDGIEAGFIQLGFESWNKRMRVWDLLVKEKFRHLGIGSRLIHQAEIDARKWGARMLVLETQSCNVPAITFYRKHGFELIGLDLASYSNSDLQKKEVRLEFGLEL